jgi:membrane-associated phospholipid phosphatase
MNIETPSNARNAFLNGLGIEPMKLLSTAIRDNRLWKAIVLSSALITFSASGIARPFPPELDRAAPCSTQVSTLLLPAGTQWRNPFATCLEACRKAVDFALTVGRMRWTSSAAEMSSAARTSQATGGFTYVDHRPKGGDMSSQAPFGCSTCRLLRFHLDDAQWTNPAANQAQRLATPKLFAGDVLHAEEQIWKFPWEVAHGHHWKPALAFTLATAGLVELDPHDDPYFRRTQASSGFNRTFSSFNTGLGEGLFPAAFFMVGLKRKDRYAEKTALLAGEAIADSEIVSEIMKNIDRRLRPRQIPPNGNFADTWFKAGGGILINRGSFPSGHAIGTFSMATVIAERYRQHRWVPWVAYGLASLVGFSRITLQAHFPSDIFAGAVLGYAISHYVVLRNQE